MLAGDWRQILPVVRKGGRPDIVEACLKSSSLWQHVKVIKLSTNMRVKQTGGNFNRFANYLLKIGEGRVQLHNTIGPYKIKLQDNFIFKGDALLQLCDFQDLTTKCDDTQWLCL